MGEKFETIYSDNPELLVKVDAEIYQALLNIYVSAVAYLNANQITEYEDYRDSTLQMLFHDVQDMDKLKKRKKK
jgi:hypothetical protein